MPLSRRNKIDQAFRELPPVGASDEIDSEEVVMLAKLKILWIAGDIEVPRSNKSVEDVKNWIARTAVYLAQDSDPEHIAGLANSLMEDRQNG